MEDKLDIYSIEDEIAHLQSLGTFKKPKLLMHACCAPCSTYCVDYLYPYFDITLYYYNPNIMPDEEWQKRAAEFDKLIAKYPEVKLIIPDQSTNEFLDLVKGYEKCPEGGDRCAVCFNHRLNKTAHEATNGFDFFTTTLTVSPHKNAELINSIGRQAGMLTGTKYLDSNFKKKNGYLKSIQLCAELGIYRQSYCGCRL